MHNCAQTEHSTAQMPKRRNNMCNAWMVLFSDSVVIAMHTWHLLSYQFKFSIATLSRSKEQHTHAQRKSTGFGFENMMQNTKWIYTKFNSLVRFICDRIHWYKYVSFIDSCVSIDASMHDVKFKNSKCKYRNQFSSNNQIFRLFYAIGVFFVWISFQRNMFAFGPAYNLLFGVLWFILFK